jgi:hypothetical protein
MLPPEDHGTLSQSQVYRMSQVLCEVWRKLVGSGRGDKICE